MGTQMETNRNSKEVGKRGESSWQDYCQAKGLPCSKLPVSKGFGEKRPDYLVVVDGQTVSIEVKAISVNPDWDAALDRGPMSHTSLMRKLAGQPPELKRVWWQVRKSETQHASYATHLGGLIPSMTILVDDRAVEDRVIPLVEHAKNIVAGNDSFEHSWKRTYIGGLAYIGVLVDGSLEVLENPYCYPTLKDIAATVKSYFTA